MLSRINVLILALLALSSAASAQSTASPQKPADSQKTKLAADVARIPSGNCEPTSASLRYNRSGGLADDFRGIRVGAETRIRSSAETAPLVNRSKAFDAICSKGTRNVVSGVAR